ncbi:5-formyltetrahydrofolate cyclo-ligase [Holothuria leucospilota]|uniref:5-formyltetrahydrofolate cyclo-ligase n=1 Tax=Holothuria leucospilota TaxID=206669 RepID=A0A9Q1BM18_HOLLE|nr:5-formyltetrahydrofolate cyclo-ligase [Holothuria leucospilota]
MSVSVVRETKRILRKELKKWIAGLTEEERQLQSENVVKQLLGHPVYQKSKRISVYLSMPQEEVNTEGILRHMFTNGKICFVPQYIGPKMEMLRLHSMEDYESLPVTKWNIKQPAEGDAREEALSSGGLDLIIMPGLGFTLEGDRLGRGKGYYDKYLQRCAEHSTGMPATIAIAFKEQIAEKLPVTENDRRVDEVLYGYKDGS